MTAHTLTSVKRCVLRRVCIRSIMPVVYVDAAVLEALRLEVWHVVGVKRRKTGVARRTVEEHHVSEHSLGRQHLTKKFLTERRVNLGSTNRDVVGTTHSHDSRKLFEIFALKPCVSQRTLPIERPFPGTYSAFVENIRSLMRRRARKVY